MFQVLNHTPFQATVAPLIDKDGQEIAVCSLKATFQLRDGIKEPTLADEQLAVLPMDTYFDTPDNSGIKYPSDLVLGKPNTDIGLIGSVHSTMNKPVEKLTASLQVGPHIKKICAYGDRFWTKSLLRPGYTMTKPKTFVRMPIRCDRLYGGTDEDSNGNSQVYNANPHGTGFFLTNKKVGGSRVPNFELPENRISSWRKHPLPATFGFANASWPHRISHGGTYDDNWKNTQFPLYPEDMDERFFNCAQKELIAKGFLKGGEPVVLKNLTPSGLLTFTLPVYTLQVTFHLLSESVTRNADCYTLVIEPDENRFYMTWSSRIKIGKLRSNLLYAEAAIITNRKQNA